MSTKVSVIICTHNPRADYLQRTLEALQAQSLSKGEWELILIDNASAKPLKGIWDLSWHPKGRTINEKSLGLTMARLCGIKNSTGENIFFVDDDNELDPQYLKIGLELIEKYPNIGVFGGQILPKYDNEPPLWFKKFEHLLAVRRIEKDIWGNDPEDHKTTPVGAGMVVRRIVAEKYYYELKDNLVRQNLDRKGDQLFGGGDIDMSITACEMGFGKGIFKDLLIHHLIPPARVQIEYLAKLNEQSYFSKTLRDAQRYPALALSQKGLPRKLKTIAYEFYKTARMSKYERVIYCAQKKGEKKGIREFLLKSKG